MQVVRCIVYIFNTFQGSGRWYCGGENSVTVYCGGIGGGIGINDGVRRLYGAVE